MSQIGAIDASENPVLVLMMKRSIPGYGKQRLASEIGQQNAQDVSTALLNCALEDADEWEGNLVFAVSQESEGEWARGLARQTAFKSRAVQVFIQCEGNLGARLGDLDRRLRTTAGRRVLLMATDAPGLTTEHFQSVLSTLNDCDIALANSSDGGADLMGSRVPWPDMSELPWGTANLGDSLATFCEEHSRSVRRFEGSFDVDTKIDLNRATDSLANDMRIARQELVKLINQLGIS